MIIMRGKRGQIWVETVIYTLIAFTLIGLVLTFAKPKIEELQDKGLLDQSVNVLEEIDLVIKNIGSPGNQRVINLGIGKGTLNIDGENEKIFFEIESLYEYSDPGKEVERGNLLINNQQTGDFNRINLTIEYENHNITNQNLNTLRKIERSPNPYKVLISNEGLDEDEKTIINIEIIN
ncbi:MAG: hypothetical protein Q8P81_00115 [Nanoarchaeota archaeon]|nr:hypothetical protein [Nanoarchaeota archaeon]